MSPANGDKYILLVEDNPDDVTLTELALKKSRIPNRLVAVSDGEEALDYLFGRGKYDGRDTSCSPSVMLLDLKLPRVGGLEVLEQVRSDARTCDIPVLMLTSSTELRDQSESLRLGANGYLRKPTGLTPLIGILQQIKSDWLS